MACKVSDVYSILNEIAPFDTQMDFDNAGLLLGHPDAPVECILTALDATSGVVEEAKRVGAQLLVTHHPVFFRPVKRLVETDPEARNVCALIRANIALIAAHTNFDMAEGGVNDALAEQLGWRVRERGELLRYGEFDEPVLLETLAEHAGKALNAVVVLYGGAKRQITRWAICSGAGGSEAAEAAENGAELLVTGEIRHHEALEAMERGMCVLEAGHFFTEFCAARQLQKHLQERLNALQYKVKVLASDVHPFQG